MPKKYVEIGPRRRIRGNAEYNIPKTFELHPDAIEAHARMVKRFRPSMGAGIGKKLISFGLILLENEIEKKEVVPGDDIEEALEIQAAQPVSNKKNHNTNTKTS